MKKRLSAAVIATAVLAALVMPASVAPAAADGTPDLVLTSALPSAVLLGTTIPVTLTLTNPSGPDGFNATFTDILPSGVSYVGGSASPEPLVLPQGDGSTVLVWKNVADALVGTSVTLNYELATGPGFDVGDGVTNSASAHANSDARFVPTFDAVTGAITGGFTGSATAGDSTSLVPFTLGKSEPSAEDELLRGVHDHQTVYSLTITNNLVNPTNGFSVIDYLPAQLEFLGCGGADNSSADEYTSSGAINPGNEPAMPNPCLTPSSVTTVTTDPDGVGSLPLAVYTRVEWDAVRLDTDLLAGESFTMDYLAAIPMRENVQATLVNTTANLDNNTGPLTTESESEMENYAIASGLYNGSATPTTASAREQVVAEDLSIHKTVDSPTFAQGDTPVFTLVVETSEYASATGFITVTDTLPSSLDLVGASPTVDRQTLNPDGTLAVEWDLNPVAANGIQTITITSSVRAFHRLGDGSNGVPVASNDSHVNLVEVASDVNVITASNRSTTLVPMVDHSSASQESEGPSILKEVSDTVGGVLTCGDGTGVTFDPTQGGPYRPGDRVCFRLSVDFPSNMDTLSPIVSDLLPNGFSMDSWVAGANSDIATGDMTFADNAPFLEWTFADQDTGGVHIEIVVATTVDDPLQADSGDLLDNLMKFRYSNQSGDVFQLRDLAIAQWGEADLTLDKGVIELNGSGVVGAPADGVTAQEGDVLTYQLTVSNSGSQVALDSSVRDVLPDSLSCADVDAISDGGTCDGPNGWIEWDAADNLDIAGGSSQLLTYDVTIPVGISAGASLLNEAGVMTYVGETNSGTPFTYVPQDNIDPSLTPNAGAADDDSGIITELPTLTKTRNTSITGDAGNPNDRATIGETVSFELDLDLPGGTTYYAASLTDVVPAGMDLDTASVTATLDGGALPVALTLTADNGANSVTVDFADPYSVPTGPDQELLVTFDAVVLDASVNVRDFSNPNSADFDFENVDGDSFAVTDSIDTRIVEPNIAVTKSNDDPDGVVAAGQTITYTVQVTNDDAIDEVSVAHDTVVSDVVPPELIVLEATGDPAEDGDTIAPDGGVWNAGTRTIIWTLATIDPGSTVSLGYEVETQDPLVAAGTLENTVSVVTSSLPGSPASERTHTSTDGDEDGDGYLADAVDSVTVPVLSVAKTAAPTTVTVGEPVNFSVDLTIPAGVVAYDVAVVDELPVGLTYESLTSISCDEAGGTCSPAITTGDASVVLGGGDVAFFFDDLTTAASGARVVTIDYVAVVADVSASDDGSTLTNAAQTMWNASNTIVATPGSPPDSSTFDGASSVATASVTTVEPHLTLDKDAAGQTGDSDTVRAQPGDTISYTVTLTNTGNAPAHDVTVADVPTDATWVFADTTVAAGVTTTDADPAGGLEWMVDGPIPIAGQITISYQLTVPPGFGSTDELPAGPELSNDADVTSYYAIDEATRLANPLRPARNYDDVTPDSVDVELDLASIGNYVWLDVDADGDQDGDEPPLADVTVTVTWLGVDGVLGGGDDEVFTTTTAANGQWLVDELPGGLYIVEVDQLDTDLPGGLVPSWDLDGALLTPNGSWSGTLDEDEDKDDVDFGFTGSGSIGDTIWFDQDLDGVVDAGESGLQGIGVTVTWLGPDGSGGGGDDIEYAATTDGAGDYLVENLPAGEYTVVVDTGTVPAGYVNVSEPGVENDDTSAHTLVDGEDNRSQNFGYAGTGSIGDTIWLDQNGDGVQNGTEPGLGGVAVELTHHGIDGVTGGGDDSTFTTVTDGDGNYLFENLPPGSYQVEVTGALPANVTNSHDPDTGTAGDSVSTVSLADDEDRDDQDFGYRSTSVLGDRVWWDLNLDGVQDGNEPGLGGVEVTATYLGPDNTIGTVDDEVFVTTTDALGSYLFDDVADGDYVVAVTGSIPSGLDPTFDEDSGTASPDAATSVALSDEHLTADFGYAGSGWIGDTVWFDADRDGLFDPEEFGLEGIDVELTWFGPDGGPGGGDDLLLTTTTDGDGDYGFPNLPAGNFSILVVAATLPTGLDATFDADGTTTTPDGSTPVALTAGETVDSTDFGYAGSASIGDTVWLDRDADGELDAGETGIGGVGIDLEWASPTGPETLATTTAADGTWSFPNLPPGDYTVSVDTGSLPPGLTPTFDADAGFDHVSARTISTGEDAADQDFGYRGDAAIGETIWLDLDGDGTIGTDEPGVADQLVELTWQGPTGPVVFTTRTEADGSYLFAALPDGDFTVAVIGGIADRATNTGDPGADGDSTNDITLAGGVSDLDQNFGYQGSNSVGDTVWIDTDRDGIVDGDETPIEGAELTIVWLGPDGAAGTDDDVTLPGATTDAGGRYGATGLPDGSWRLEVVSGLPTGVTTPTWDSDDEADSPDGRTTLADLGVGSVPGVDDINQDFGFTGDASIGDTIWIDLDGDDTQDDDEPGLPGLAVMLTGAGVDGIFDTVDDVDFGTATTDDIGEYLFEFLPPGAYRVDWSARDLDDGFVPQFDPDGGDLTSAEVILAAAEAHRDADFAVRGDADLSGRIFIDEDQDGVDDGEEGLQGVDVAVSWVGPDGPVSATVTTDADGNWSLSEMPPGAYTIQVDTTTVPDDLVPTLPGALELSVAPGDAVVAAIAFIPAGTIGDLVWEDENRNGLVDPGEPGVPGIGVTLTLEDAVVAEAITDASGNYLFEELAPGTYVVSLDVDSFPDDFVIVASPDAEVDGRATVVVGLDEDVLTIDFGLDAPESPSALALTGSSVADLVILGILLFVIGLVLTSAGRKRGFVVVEELDLAELKLR